MIELGDEANLPPSLYSELVDLPLEEAVVTLRARELWSVPVAMLLADWALGRAESNPEQAGRMLALVSLVAGEHGEPPELVAQIAYAEARRAVHSGDLGAAEAALLRAQENWRVINARVPFARTFLGLTQVLTMQGRYGEAESAVASAIAELQTLAENDAANRLLLSRALRNQATLFVYQERHAAARDAYQAATEELARFAETLPAEEQGELEEELGHLALNLASAHTFLDAPAQAESLLLEAIGRFDRLQDEINRGRAHTNLGRLYLRLGEYAAALASFNQAQNDLMGAVAGSAPLTPEEEMAALRQADELLLEHALAYLALNLLPEATLSLERCERLFRSTGQPYELAQSRYAQGVLRLQQGAWQESQAALNEALMLYEQLGNPFWRNRTQTALARLALAQGDQITAARYVEELLRNTDMVTPAGAVAWDLLGLVDVWLMQLQIRLENGELGDAENAARAVEGLLGISTSSDLASNLALPHLALRLLHARGRIAAAQGNEALARRHFTAAVDLLDRQRATLPLEEVRTAYLGDKMAMYSDLVLSLLASPLPSEDEVATAFAIVERARSRALLERLLASVEVSVEDEDAEISAQRAELRRQLHWLYNQLLGDSGNRSLDGVLGREVAQHEAAIQQLEWRSAPILAQAEPVHLSELQATLNIDQQAIIYYFAGSEVLAFIVSCDNVRVVRHLTTVEAISQAQVELRFQLGRAEMGSEYITRHYQRLMRGAEGALGQLFQLLVAPLIEFIQAPRVLLIPYGTLHLVPFHALWTGTSYWLEQVELTYVPSASLAVRRKSALADTPYVRFAGFAPFDERIPYAQTEIDTAATYFHEAESYHHDAATLANLKGAASSTDVLHMATHGLFRSDNSFFSALKLADGWLDVREIYRLPLSARLVVLSACESGVGEVRAGDEVVGLARGFLAAGTQCLIASLWNVHDISAAELMGHFYRMLQCVPPTGIEAGSTVSAQHEAMRPAAALRAAQLHTLRTGAHPYFWAPFFAIG